LRHSFLFALLAIAAESAMFSCTDRADVGAFARNGAVQDAGGGATRSEAGEAPSSLQLTPVVTPIAAGSLSTCALTAAGGAVCWGDNNHGALGMGGMTPPTDPDKSTTPLRVQGLSSGVRAVAGGGDAQCAILTDGTARCWGYSLFGEALGVSGTVAVQMPYPHDHTGLGSDVAQISFGYLFACALTTSGHGKCWGLGGSGQLGSGTTDDSYIAEDIKNPKEGLIYISAAMAGLFACAVGSTGSVYCWGHNAKHQLGSHDTADLASPTAVEGLDGRAIQVAAGEDHACALFDDGGVACWGSDERGQLGRGATGTPASPRRVDGLPRASSLVAGGFHACAIVEGGAVWCWGANDFQQLGGSGVAAAPLEEVPASFGAVAVTAGLMHTCVIDAAQNVRCWGDNTRDQIGAGTFSL
jgi:alpha-tubulin suppressor-like RCC1 family protein